MVCPFKRVHLLAAFAGDDQGIDLPRPDGYQGLFRLFETKPKGVNLLVKLSVCFSSCCQNYVPVEGQAPKECVQYWTNPR